MSSICLADAWANAYESILSMRMNEHEQLRVRRAYHALLDRYAMRTESSCTTHGERTFLRRVHEFPDTSFVVGTADVALGDGADAVDWTYCKPDQDSPGMFTFGTLEVLSTVLSTTYWPDWDVVQAASAAVDLR